MFQLTVQQCIASVLDHSPDTLLEIFIEHAVHLPTCVVYIK